MSANRILRLLLCAIAGLALMIGVAACGDDGDGGSTSGSTTGTSTEGGGSGESAGIEEAKATVAEFETLRPDFLADELPPLPEKPPAGQQVFIATCALEVCQVVSNAAKEGAAELDWKVKEFSFPPAPEAYVKTWEQMLADPLNPSYIIVSGVITPNESIAPMLNEAEKRGIKIIEVAPAVEADDKPGKYGVIATMVNFTQQCEKSKLAANYALSDAGGPIIGMSPVDPQFESQVIPGDCFKQATEELSPESSVENLDISITAPPEQSQQKIVNYLQRNPDTEYIYVSQAALGQNLRQVLDSAGLDSVEILTASPTASEIAALENGEVLATVQTEEASIGWRAIDVFARDSVGEDPGPNSYPVGYFRILTPETEDLQLENGVPVTPGTPEAFLEAWQVK